MAGDYDGSVVASIGYKNGSVVTLNILDGARVPFSAVTYGSKGAARYERDSAFPSYYYGMKHFLEMVKTGKPPIPYNDLILPVRVLDAIQRSMDGGGREVVLR